MDNLELLIPILAIVFGSMIFLIPIAGLTARFALKPIMEAIAKMREMQSQRPDQGREIAMLEQRMALLEQQLHAMESVVEEIEHKREFDRQLGSGG